MEKELLFAKALKNIKELAKQQGNIIAKEQVERTFAELMLSKEQLALVYDYLHTHKIGVETEVNFEDYMTKEEIDYLSFYLEELEELPEVSEREKQGILLSAMAGNIDAQKKAIELFLPQVVELAKLYVGQGVYLEDLIGEGNIALTASISMLGCQESVSEAEGMMGKLLMDAMEAVIKENLEYEESDKKMIEKVNQVAEKAEELSQLLHRKISMEELTEETGFTEEEIKEVLRILGGNTDNIENGEEFDGE